MAPGQQHTIRIAIRSERRMFRDALSECLRAQSEYLVVGHVGRLDDLLALCRLCRPDIALVDVGASHADAACLRDCAALTKVVAVYDRLSPDELGDLCRIGVDILVPCSHGLDALLVVLRRHLAETRDDSTGPAAAHDGLSELERRIITLVGVGHTVDQIARLLEVSASSVANIKRRIYRKLQVVSQGQAVARATALGIVAQPPAHLRPECRRAGAVLAVLRGTAGPAWQQVTAALLAGGVPFTTDGGLRRRTVDLVGAAGSLVVLVDPAPEDWPGGQEAGLPVVLVRTEPPRRAEALAALLRGACAVLTVEHVATDLVPAFTLAAHGHVTVEADAARAVLDAARTPAAPGLPELSCRELDILLLIANGHTVRQTARALGIAEKTVENTQSRLYRKLGARNRAGALAAAHALGLLEPRHTALSPPPAR
jgi:DNA-binding NarL/FixJ family response regulator